MIESLVCMTLAVYFEARDQPIEGQIAVAQVILNRVEDERWPDSVCEVVKQGGEKRNACQFSFWCDGKSEKIREHRSWSQATIVAALTLLGAYSDPTFGSLFYHSTSANPQWRYRQTIQIEDHIFYVY